MENTELQKWIAFFLSIGFVKFASKAESAIIAKFRRFVGPKNFDDKYVDEKNWFYIEVILYEDKISYEFKRGDNEGNFDRRDESKILSIIVNPAFTSATGDFVTMEETLSQMMKKLEDLINHPTDYIKNKLADL